MKKYLAIALLSSATTVALADGYNSAFQKYDNNVAIGTTNSYVNQNAWGQTAGYVMSADILTNIGLWIDGQFTNNNFYSNRNNVVNAGGITFMASSLGSGYIAQMAAAKVGYALGNDLHQFIPYVNYGVGSAYGNNSQNYGAGVKSEANVIDGMLKLSLDINAYDATINSGTGSMAAPAYVVSSTFAGNANQGFSSDFRYSLTPEIQYSVDKYLLTAVGYSYDQSFNGATMNHGGNSTLYFKVGYNF